MPLFCRHNRFEHTCPICSREKAAADKPQAKPAPRRATTTTRSTGARGGSARNPRQRHTNVVVKRAFRTADDGYSSSLVPGIRGSADARRLAGLVAAEDAFLLALATDPPELWSEVADAATLREAAERAYAIIIGGSAVEAPLAQWFERHGGPERAFTIEPSWPATRRFDRLFERLALPGFDRAKRFRFLIALGSLGLIEAEPATLWFGATGDDDTTLGGKRVLNSGDAMLLDRRAAALADALDVPLAALDGALAAYHRGELIADEDAPASLVRLAGALGV